MLVASILIARLAAGLGEVVVRPNQVGAMDITSVAMAHGFVDLAAVLDWFSRRALSWRVWITMDVDLCLDAVEAALARHGRPEIFNTDQGSQFTSAGFTGLLLRNAVALSRDGRGAWRDDLGVERLWRWVEHEEVDLQAYDSVGEAHALMASIWRSTPQSARTRAWTRGRRIKPASAVCRNARQHDPRRRGWGVAPVELRPVGTPPINGTTR